MLQTTSSNAVISLLRNLLRKERTLLYTDREVYRHRVIKEFRTYQGETNPRRIDALLRRGVQFYKENNVL